VSLFIPQAEDGRLGFRNYLYGVINLTQPLLEDTQFLHSMFNFFDKNGDGILKAEDLSRLPLHSLPNPLPKPTEDYTGRYQNSKTTPTEMNFDDFKSVLTSNPEYLAIFHECQNAGISFLSPQTNNTPLTVYVDVPL